MERNGDVCEIFYSCGIIARNCTQGNTLRMSAQDALSLIDAGMLYQGEWGEAGHFAGDSAQIPRFLARLR